MVSPMSEADFYSIRAYFETQQCKSEMLDSEERNNILGNHVVCLLHRHPYPTTNEMILKSKSHLDVVKKYKEFPPPINITLTPYNAPPACSRKCVALI